MGSEGDEYTLANDNAINYLLIFSLLFGVSVPTGRWPMRKYEMVSELYFLSIMNDDALDFKRKSINLTQERKCIGYSISALQFGFCL